MGKKVCPYCKNELTQYPEYFYCYACSKQFKKGFFGKMKEIENTLQSDQKQAMG